MRERERERGHALPAASSRSGTPPRAARTRARTCRGPSRAPVGPAACTCRGRASARCEPAWIDRGWARDRHGVSVHALVLLAGVEEQHPRAVSLVLLQQRARLAPLRARALVRQPLRRRKGSDKWHWIERHGVGGVGAPGTQSSSGRSCTFAARPLGVRWPGCSRSARGRSARAGPSSASRRRSSGPGKASSARAACGRHC